MCDQATVGRVLRRAVHVEPERVACSDSDFNSSSTSNDHESPFVAWRARGSLQRDCLAASSKGRLTRWQKST